MNLLQALKLKFAGDADALAAIDAAQSDAQELAVIDATQPDTDTAPLVVGRMVAPESRNVSLRQAFDEQQA